MKSGPLSFTRRRRVTLRTIVSCIALGLVACVMTTGPTAQPADVTITRSQFGSSVALTVGQGLVVPMPVETHEWQVEVPRQLELLTAAEKRRNPGPSGWRFRAVATGDGEITLTLIAKEGDAAPPQMTLAVHVTR